MALRAPAPMPATRIARASTGVIAAGQASKDRQPPVLGDSRETSCEHLADVHGVDRGPAIRGGEAVGYHHHAERTGCGDGLGARLEHLAGPFRVDPRAAVLLHPHVAAAGPAA